MRTKIEGLLLSKTDFQERHLICSILIRTGKKVTVLFYGGQGGGKKKKPSQLEVGTMLEIELSVSRATTDFHRAKEWKLIWRPENIRNNFRAFTLLCFYCEMASKIAGEENLYQDDLTTEQAGLFGVFSNAIYYLENSIVEERFEQNKELTVFLGKILGEQGVFPQLESCSLCESELSAGIISDLSFEHGGFICSECAPLQRESALSNELWYILGPIGSLKYPELVSLKQDNNGLSRLLVDFLLHQFQLEARSFKSLSMVFQL